MGGEDDLLPPSFGGKPPVLDDYGVSFMSVIEFFTGAGAEHKHLARQG